MTRAILLAALLAGAAFASPAPAAQDPLPRKASLGLQLQSAPGGQGVAVGTVFPNATGASLGVQSGDLLKAVNGTKVSAVGEAVALAQRLRSGERVTLDVVRGGKPLTLRGKAQPRPLEQFEGATVDYGSVAFRGNRLRDVLVMPAGNAQAPVVYFIQGFSCGAVEGGPRDDLYYRLGEELIARGIGYYRVEKVGQGDSDGPLRCQEVDFATETDAFRSAYRHLMTERRIAPERIFMVGHSLGGLTAPLLAAETAPRGIAVYGTVVRNWADYHHDLEATQPFLIEGADPAAAASDSERTRDILRMFYFDKASPASIAAARPGFAEAMRANLAWDGKESIFGRHYKFAQQLASLPLLDAWKNSKTNVLAIYGASDMVALTDVDHRYLADIANYWRPGSGKYVEIADTDHGMSLVGSRAAIRERNRAGGPPLEGPFNVKVAEELAAWIKASMATTPLA